MSTWVLVGDSQAVGLKPHMVELMRARGWQLVGSSTFGGWSTGRMVNEGELPALSRLEPALAVVVLGGNDQPNSALAGKIGDLVEKLRWSSHPRIVWVGPAHSTRPEVNERKDRVAAIQRQIIPRLGVWWIDGQRMTEDLPHTPDGVHFSTVGRRLWAERLVLLLLGASRVTRSSALLLGVAAGAVAGALGLVFFAARRA